MNKYLVINNHKPNKNTIVITKTEQEAIDEGASRLKTWNVRCITAAEQTHGTINQLGFEILK